MSRVVERALVAINSANGIIIADTLYMLVQVVVPINSKNGIINIANRRLQGFQVPIRGGALQSRRNFIAEL